MAAGDILWTGYDTVTTVTFAGTQTMNSAVNDEYTNLSNEINNATSDRILADFMLELGSCTPSGGDAGWEIFIVPSLDGGTTYPDWSGNTTTENNAHKQYSVGFFPVIAATQSHVSVLRGIVLPVAHFKVGMRNLMNVTAAASGNVLEMYRYTQNVAQS